MKKLKIAGMGRYLPERVLTNQDLEKMVDTSDEWIVQRTGIKERRIAREDEYAVEMAIKAAKMALENAKIGAEEIDFIIFATDTPDTLCPGCGCQLQEAIGAKNAMSIDTNVACTGFIAALVMAEQFIKTGYYKKILIVASEILSKVVDYTDRNICILFGDGAGAAVCVPSEDNSGLISSTLGTNGAGGKYITMGALKIDEEESAKRPSGEFKHLWMDGSEVMKFAVRTMAEATKKVVEEAGMSMNDVDVLIPHQANIRIIDGAVKRLKIDGEKVVVNLQKYGNNGCASIPIAMCEAIAEGKIKKGDKVGLVGFGGGLTWGAVLLEW